MKRLTKRKIEKLNEFIENLKREGFKIEKIGDPKIEQRKELVDDTRLHLTRIVLKFLSASLCNNFSDLGCI